jgi:signal transduction histidine kinase
MTVPDAPTGRLASVLAWPRLHGRSVRLRLTLIYGGLFLVLGVILLALTYLLAAHRFPIFVTTAHDAPPSAVPPQFRQAESWLATQAARQRAAALETLLTQSGIALAITTVISVALGWVVAGRVLRPLRDITAAARRISASNLHERLRMNGPEDELTELGNTFDGLLARLEGAFDAQRQFVANASHELRTPLARQRAMVEVALADPGSSAGSLRAICQRVLVAGEQQERLIEALLTLARSNRGLDRRQPIDLAKITDDVTQSWQPEAELRMIRVDIRATPAWVLGEESLAQRLVANLVDNALRHNVANGWVEISTTVQDGRAVLSVANTGPVIEPALVSGLFEPFRRAGPDRTRSRDGTGLGLSIVQAIVTAHDAQVRARARSGGGLEVQVRFPPAPSVREAAPDPGW